MFNVAARIFKTTYVANIIFEPDSSGLDNFSLCHRIYHTKPADWSEALTVAILSTFQAKKHTLSPLTSSSTLILNALFWFSLRHWKVSLIFLGPYSDFEMKCYWEGQVEIFIHFLFI